MGIAKVLVDHNGNIIGVPDVDGNYRLATEATISGLSNTIPSDVGGDPLPVVPDVIIPSGVNGLLAAGIDSGSNARLLTIDSEQRLRVTMAETSSNPVHVVVTTGTQSYYHIDLTNADGPAKIESTTEPFDVGGTTLTIDVNGEGDQTSTFPTRVAQPGIAISGPNPATKNGNLHELKVSIDAGAEKKISISENLTTGDAIAAAIQAEIRANVENGTGVTVEYNTVEYPLRYIIKSGTTGSSSSVQIRISDDLVKIIKLASFGENEYPGTDANHYLTHEVVEQIDNDITNVIVEIGENLNTVTVETLAGGISATLEVEASGANTALQFPTTEEVGTSGSGSSSMTVDGSTTPVRFSVVIPEGQIFAMSKLIIYIRDDDIALKKFGGLAEIINGLSLEVKSENLALIPVLSAVTNADLMSQADSSTLFDDAFAGGGKDLLKTTFDFGAGVRMPSGTTSNVYVTVQDDLRDIDSMFARAVGWIE